MLSTVNNPIARNSREEIYSVYTCSLNQRLRDCLGLFSSAAKLTKGLLFLSCLCQLVGGVSVDDDNDWRWLEGVVCASTDVTIFSLREYSYSTHNKFRKKVIGVLGSSSLIRRSVLSDSDMDSLFSELRTVCISVKPTGARFRACRSGLSNYSLCPDLESFIVDDRISPCAMFLFVPLVFVLLVGSFFLVKHMLMKRRGESSWFFSNPDQGGMQREVVDNNDRVIADVDE